VTRTARTLLVAGVSALLLGLVLLFAPVPYVILVPTVPTNTLGDDPRTPGQPVCDVKGPTHPTTGQLDLTTVGVAATRPVLGVALYHWLRSHDAVVPRAILYPPGQTTSETDKQNAQAMTDSRSAAVQAALDELDYPDTVVGAVTQGSAADGKLAVGDKITAIDGHPVTTFDGLAAQVHTHRPGDRVEVSVVRQGEAIQVPVVLGASKPTDGSAPTAQLGVERVDADFSLARVSGPSAGLMFALCVIDKLTPTDLANGRIIAGTGEIDPQGDVDAIGGVQQKIFGAAQAGARYFLVPADNCAEAKKAVPSGMQLIKVPHSTPTETSLHSAYTSLKRLRAGDTNLPRC
jgi:PDZ domain-containing protein